MIIRVVLDTNIFISGIFWSGSYCSQIIDAWKAGRFTLVSSLPLIEELTKILKTFKIKMEEEMIEEWRKIIVENSVIVEPAEKLTIIKDDPADNMFLEAALAGDAGYIISQDHHLLRIADYQGIRIITPDEFLILTKQE